MTDIERQDTERQRRLEEIQGAFNLKKNPWHPLVFVNGWENLELGENVYVGYLSDIHAVGSKIVIKDNCDIASFVDINVADSHKRCIGISEEIERGPITLEENVFVGSHSFIGRNTHIGHHSVVAAGTILIWGWYNSTLFVN